MFTNSERSILIKRATLAAIARRNSQLDTAVDDVAALYQAAADAVSEHIQHSGERGGGRLGLHDLQELLAIIRERVNELGRERDSLLNEHLVTAVSGGAGVFRPLLSSGQIYSINVNAVGFVHNFTAADGLQLSDRLWRVNRHTRDVLTDYVQSAIINGESAHQAMMGSMGRGQGVPPDIARAFRGAESGIMSQGIRTLMTGAPDPVNGKGVVYQAERLFRTEINRAHGEAYMAAAFQTDGVRGVRFMLSPNHRKTDICDTHAAADLYGLGPGVYPSRAACPWPAHPNTLSYIMAVFEGDDIH